MKNNEDKENFIALRAQGISFDKISTEIGVSKPTLLKWDQEFAKEIANLRYLEADSLLTQYKLAKQHESIPVIQARLPTCNYRKYFRWVRISNKSQISKELFR